MDLKIGTTFLLMTISMSACKHESSQIPETQRSLVFPKGQSIQNNNFTGNVWLEMLVEADSMNLNSVGSVTFESGARTHWHLHPGGQILLAIDGEGYYQEKGSPKRTLKKGDIVKCPPNIPHWHGTTEQSDFIQIAITSRAEGPTV